MTNISNNLNKYTQVTTFESIKSVEKMDTDIWYPLDRIKNGASKNLVQKFRETGNSSYKLSLPAVTFGACMQDRITLRQATGLAIFDYDHVENVHFLKWQLSLLPYTFAVWISPSGTGIKHLVRIPIVKDKHEYKEYYFALLDELEEYGPDTATSDINRLCFESYDPQLIVKWRGVEVFKKKKDKPFLRPSFPEPQQTIGVRGLIKDDTTISERLLRWWTNKFSFGNGSRNSSLFILACAFCEFGLSEGCCLYYLESFAEEDFTSREIEGIVRSAYKKAAFNSKSFAI